MDLLSVLPVAIGCHNEAAEAQITGVFMHVEPVLGQGGFRTLYPLFLAALLPTDRSICSVMAWSFSNWILSSHWSYLSVSGSVFKNIFKTIFTKIYKEKTSRCSSPDVFHVFVCFFFLLLFLLKLPAKQRLHRFGMLHVLGYIPHRVKFLSTLHLFVDQWELRCFCSEASPSWG